ncbi:TOPRIM nucleotidyl transferase/hydrolase domain-containing protein [Aeromicrobium sp. Root236]|uniref:TOPRIM nucleotidyl transferase/hydrolase domain-containing protein n=1 Tax=Aeromicrobium sp. Root236 TaxID=1736498 RepID=UPI000B16BAE9
MTRLRDSLVAWAAGGDGVAARELATGLRTVALVEGVSDQAAVERLAVRRGRDLDAAGVCVVPMGGATNIRRFVDVLGPEGLGTSIAGLCDRAELGFFERALARAGLGLDGFFVCDPDLEGELIRALGTAAVEAVIAHEGETRAYDIFRQQPAQRDRTTEDRLHRFMGTHSGRKEQYGRALVDALDLGHVPRPLDDLLDRLTEHG